jgi:hypothetical protein
MAIDGLWKIISVHQTMEMMLKRMIDLLIPCFLIDFW